MMKSIRNFYLLIVVLISTAQAQKVDSLLHALNNYKTEDTVRVKLLYRISFRYAHSNPSAGLEYARLAITSARSINDKHGLANGYFSRGINEFIRSNYNDALKSFDTAILYCRLIKNKMLEASVYDNMGSTYRFMSEYAKSIECNQKFLVLYQECNAEAKTAIPLFNTGSVYNEMSDYPKALEYYQKGMAIDERFGTQSDIAIDLYDIGVVYFCLNDFKKALDNFQKAKIINERNADTLNLAYNVGSIANAYLDLGDNTKALEHYNLALKYDEQLGNKSLMANTLNNMGSFYEKNNNYTKALESHLKSLAINESIDSRSGIAENFGNIASAYINMKEYSLALDYARKGKQLADSLSLPNYSRDCLLHLASIYEATGKYDNAYATYKDYIIFRDSILNNEKDKKISRLVMQYDFDRRSDSIRLHQQVMIEKLKEQDLLAKQQHQLLEINTKELALTNKEKDIQKLAYLKTQADLQNEQLQKQQKIKQLTLSEKEKQLQSSQLTTLSQDKILNKLTQQRLWLLAAGAFTLVVFTALFFLYRTRIRQLKLSSQLVQQKNEQQIKEAEFQHKLGDITLSALRSQMNPHFIFNCLNSIKLYAAQNDSKAASDYLTKFSRLIRQMLENSRSERISLTNEMQSLELYIQMEAMRFKEKLQYQITVDKNIDSDYIEIPPLLIQPYVENAIWHGLMQKEEGGHIAIHLSKNENDDMLTATVTDNGIGRKKATEIKSKSATKHKSYGMKVTSERIALINQVYNSNTTVEVTDLYSENGEPTGTTVVIQIPI
jgi:sensor histidine kinase YesM